MPSYRSSSTLLSSHSPAIGSSPYSPEQLIEVTDMLRRPSGFCCPLRRRGLLFEKRDDVLQWFHFNYDVKFLNTLKHSKPSGPGRFMNFGNDNWKFSWTMARGPLSGLTRKEKRATSRINRLDMECCLFMVVTSKERKYTKVGSCRCNKQLAMPQAITSLLLWQYDGVKDHSQICDIIPQPCLK